jgi:hypothetical protein
VRLARRPLPADMTNAGAFRAARLGMLTSSLTREGAMPEDTWHFEKDVVMVTGFRVGRMAQEHGPQLVWLEMKTARGKTASFACSVEHALELAELLQVEAWKEASPA